MTFPPDLEGPGLPEVTGRTPLSTDHEGPRPVPSPPGRRAREDPGWLRQQPCLGRGSPVTTGRPLQAPPEGLLPLPGWEPPSARGPVATGRDAQQRGSHGPRGTAGSLANCPLGPVRGSYLAKTFLAMRVRAVSACCFRSVRPGCLLFLPLPLLPALDEPRSTPVATSTSLINSGSCQSANRPETSENTWHQSRASPRSPSDRRGREAAGHSLGLRPRQSSSHCLRPRTQHPQTSRESWAGGSASHRLLLPSRLDCPPRPPSRPLDLPAGRGHAQQGALARGQGGLGFLCVGPKVIWPQV